MQEFRIASWNVLATAHIKPAYFRATPREALFEERRLPAVLDRIAELPADAIFLQEVEPHVFEAMKARLEMRLMRGAFVLGRDRPDGCAAFLSTSAFSDAAVRMIALPKRSVAILVEAVRGGTRLALATTHLRWAPPGTPAEDHPGLAQAQVLLEALDRTGLPAVICGDFNADIESPVLGAFIEAGFSDAYASCPTPTVVTDGIAYRFDHVLTRGLAAEPVALPAIDGTTVLPSNEFPSDHLAVGAVLRATG